MALHDIVYAGDVNLIQHVHVLKNEGDSFLVS